MYKPASPKSFREGSIEYCLAEFTQKLREILLLMRRVQQILKKDVTSKTDWLDLGERLLNIPSHQFRALVGLKETAKESENMRNENRLIHAVELAASSQLRFSSTGRNYISLAKLVTEANPNSRDTRTEFPLSNITQAVSDQRVFLEAMNIFIPTRNALHRDINIPCCKAFSDPLGKIINDILSRDPEINAARKDAKPIDEMVCRFKNFWGKTHLEQYKNSASYVAYLESNISRKPELSPPFKSEQSYTLWALESLMLNFCTIETDCIHLIQAFQNILNSLVYEALPKMLATYDKVNFNMQELLESYDGYNTWWQDSPLVELRDALATADSEQPPVIENFELALKKLKLVLRECLVNTAAINLAYESEELSPIQLFCDSFQFSCLDLQKCVVSMSDLMRVPEGALRVGFSYSYKKIAEVSKIVIKTMREGSALSLTQVESVMNSESSSSDSATTPRAALRVSVDTTDSPNLTRLKDDSSPVPPLEPQPDEPKEVAIGHGSVKRISPLKAQSVSSTNSRPSSNPASRNNTLSSRPASRGSVMGMWGDPPKRKSDSDLFIDLKKITDPQGTPPPAQNDK